MACIKISKQAYNRSYRLFNSQIRLKTYLVGVDGSKHGFSALKSASETMKNDDKIVVLHVPHDLTFYTEGTNTDSDTFQMLRHQQSAQISAIEQKCVNIVNRYAPDIHHYSVEIGNTTPSPKEELIKWCYETHCDVLAA
eukprot:900567_1